MTSKPFSTCATRRGGSGATNCVGVVVAELTRGDSWGPEAKNKSFGRGGGRGGAWEAGRGGGFGLEGGEKLERLSLELSECVRAW